MKKTKRIMSTISAMAICGASLASMSVSAKNTGMTFEDYEQYLFDNGYVKMSSAHLAYDDGYGNIILDDSLEDKYCAYFKPFSDKKTSKVISFGGIYVDKTGYDYVDFLTPRDRDNAEKDPIIDDTITEIITSIDPDLKIISRGNHSPGNNRGYSVSYGIGSGRYMSDETINSVYNALKEKDLLVDTFKYYGPTFETVYTVGHLDKACFPVKNLEALDTYLEETGAGFEYIPTSYSNFRECTSREGHSETDDCPKIEWVYCDLKQTKEYTDSEYYAICNDIARITEGMFMILRPTTAAIPISTPEYSIEMHANVKGDANGNDILELSDAVMILQAVGNPDEYGLTPQGEYNADIAGEGDGITNLDALTIQRKLLKLE